MPKLIPLLIFLSLSACGGGGSDAVETAVTDAATKQAEEEAASALAAAAQKAEEDAAAALATAISDAEAAANSNRFESATLDSSKFQ